MSELMIVFTGNASSGKGTLSEYAREEHGFKPVTASDLIRHYAEERGLPLGHRDTYRAAHLAMIEEFGHDYLSDVVLSDPAPRLAVDGIRVPHYANELRRKAGAKVVSLWCPLELRFERADQRNSLRDPGALSEFARQDIGDSLGGMNPYEQNTLHIMQTADYHIDASRAPEHVSEQFDAILHDISLGNS